MVRFILPYNFKGIVLDKQKAILSGSKLINRHLSSFYLGEGIYSQFSNIYTDILQAIAENDREYLQQIMEPRLYQKTLEGLDEIERNGYQIRYLQSEDSEPGEEYFAEEEEEVTKDVAGMKFNIRTSSDPFQYREKDMKIYLQAKGVFGVNIQRHLNQDRKYFQLTGRYSGREYYFNSKDIMQVYNNQILALNVYFRTNRQLYVVDQDEDLVKGNDLITDKLIRHKWRFETYTPDLDWVLTDMDEALDGNPYLNSQIKDKEESDE